MNAHRNVPDAVIPEPPAGVTYRPLGDGVLLRRIHLRRLGSIAASLGADDGAGLVRPDLTREHRERTIGQAVYGRVLSVGRGRVLADGTTRPVDAAIAPGAIVAVRSLAGRGVTGYGDEERFVVREGEVLGIVDNPAGVGA